MIYSFLHYGALLNKRTVLTLFSITFQDLQGIVQQQRADIEAARDTLTALCRSHPSQELADLSSELTSIAKRTESVAQCCVRTKSDLQDGLQRHFNGKKRERFSYLGFGAIYEARWFEICVLPTLRGIHEVKQSSPLLLFPPRKKRKHLPLHNHPLKLSSAT